MDSSETYVSLYYSSETYVSLYSGGGGLDLGFKSARSTAKCVAFVEHEASAAALLVDHVEAALVDPAPVYTDAFTFPAERFRGLVDWVIGGPPCQPFSVAGKRLGADDARNLWPLTLRMVGEIQPRGCFFENVPSADSLWYIYEKVIPGLRYLGYQVEAGIFSAVEVGAPHNRERIFILAYAESSERRRFSAATTTGAESEHQERSRELPDSNVAQSRYNGSGNSGGIHKGRPANESGGKRIQQEWRAGATNTESNSRELADSNGTGRQRQNLLQQRLPGTGRGERSMGNTDGLGRRAQGHGKCSPVGTDWHGRPMEWPPGPTETEKWEEVIRLRPNLAPATKPGVRGMANGVAFGLARVQQLRILGNGVVPATAAHAFNSLSSRLGAETA